MYEMSNAADSILTEARRMFRAKISASGQDDITAGFISIKQYQRSCASDYISIGDAVASYVEIQMWKPDNFSFEGTELEVSIGVVNGDGIEYCPLGLFTAQKPTDDDGVITFVAYDRLYSMMSEVYYSKLTYPTDGKNILNEISEMTGVSIDVSNLPDGMIVRQKATSTEMSIDESGNAITAVKYENPYDGYAYRDVISYVAQLYCKFVTVDRAGTVVFRWYSDDLGTLNTTSYTITASKYYDDLVVNEQPFKVNAITCVVGDKTLGSGLGMSSIQLENPVMTQEILDAIYEKVKNITFYPVSLSFYGDPRLDLGDCVKVVDKYGSEWDVPLMYISQDFDGGILTETASYGRTEQEEYSSRGPTAQKFAQLDSDIAVVKEIVGKKADFETVMAQMITTDTILFGGMTVVEFYNQMIETNALIEKAINGLNLSVSSLSTKKDLSNNSGIQSYNVTEVPALDNYPTITDFFIWDVCSEAIYCLDTLICGANDYDTHLSQIAYNSADGYYYIFEKNTDGIYGWRKMINAEVSALADKYASVSVLEGEVVITAGYEDDECEVKIGSDGMRATVLYCC